MLSLFLLLQSKFFYSTNMNHINIFSQNQIAQRSKSEDIIKDHKMKNFQMDDPSFARPRVTCFIKDKISSSPTMKGVKVLSQVSSLPRRSAQLSAPFPTWRDDCALSDTVIFHKRLNQPATIIQATFRGWSCRMKKNQPTAAILIQATVRGWMFRMKLQVENLQKRLASIQSEHRSELYQIEERKKLDMKRIYKELSSNAQIEQELEKEKRIYNKLSKAMAKEEKDRDAKHQRALRSIEKNKKREMKRIYKELTQKEREQDATLKEMNESIVCLRTKNLQLKSQNNNIQKATSAMRQNNGWTMVKTRQIYKDIKELEERIIPKQEIAQRGVLKASEDCQLQMKRIEKAASSCQEKVDDEKRISDLFLVGIVQMLMKIEQASSGHNNNNQRQVDEKVAQVIHKTALKSMNTVQKEKTKRSMLAARTA